MIFTLLGMKTVTVFHAWLVLKKHTKQKNAYILFLGNTLHLHSTIEYLYKWTSKLCDFLNINN